MKLKTLTWNIGGAKLLAKGADPSLMSSYSVDGIAEIIDLIKREQPDIVTLQETQKNEIQDQVQQIATGASFEYYVHDSTSESHIDRGMLLGHGIISRFPIVSHETDFFTNPHVQVVWEDGRTVVTYDKGYTNCIVKTEVGELQISTLHLTPFRRFKIELESDLGKTMMADLEARVHASRDKYLLQGDFNMNYAELKPFLPAMFDSGIQEVITEPTTPDGRTYDHIFYKGMKNTGSIVGTDVLTDHYPVIAMFDIE
jgi:endonuclease/exonuclease/phosphatase family metal-dependent hydrolase